MKLLRYLVDKLKSVLNTTIKGVYVHQTDFYANIRT